jgi:tetratricopeptide (TPR) repeat protein
MFREGRDGWAFEYRNVHGNCLYVTRAVSRAALSASLDTFDPEMALSFVSAEELRRGGACLKSSRLACVRRMWADASCDNVQAWYQTSGYPSFAIENLGVADLSEGHYSAAFTWYVGQYQLNQIPQSVSIDDCGYFREIVAGLWLAAEGRHKQALSSFDKSIATLAPYSSFYSPSEPYFYKGAVFLAMGDISDARKMWEKSAELVDYGLHPEAAGFASGAASAFLWLRSSKPPITSRCIDAIVKNNREIARQQ